jgi:hypothetical protein
MPGDRASQAAQPGSALSLLQCCVIEQGVSWDRLRVHLQVPISWLDQDTHGTCIENAPLPDRAQ